MPPPKAVYESAKAIPVVEGVLRGEVDRAAVQSHGYGVQIAVAMALLLAEGSEVVPNDQYRVKGSYPQLLDRLLCAGTGAAGRRVMSRSLLVVSRGSGLHRTEGQSSAAVAYLLPPPELVELVERYGDSANEAVTAFFAAGDEALEQEAEAARALQSTLGSQ